MHPRALTIAAAARHAGAMTGRNIAPSTVFRWIRDGVQGIRLRARCVGRTTCFTPEDLDTFFRELAEHRFGKPPSTPRTPATRRRAIEKAEREVEELTASTGSSAPRSREEGDRHASE